MKAFIENEAGSNQKNIYDEKTLEYIKTVTVSRKYPYPYGFIIGTTSGDGDNLDCFIITKEKLKTGETVDCKPIGIMEQIEDTKKDNNILAVLNDETAEATPQIQQELTDFISHVFDHKPEKQVTVGKFLGKEDAENYINSCLDTEYHE